MITIINEIGSIAAGLMGFVFIPAMLLGIGAFGVWICSVAWEDIERNYRRASDTRSIER